METEGGKQTDRQGERQILELKKYASLKNVLHVQRKEFPLKFHFTGFSSTQLS
jgi:hypothetical protein